MIVPQITAQPVSSISFPKSPPSTIQPFYSVQSALNNFVSEIINNKTSNARTYNVTLRRVRITTVAV